MEPVMRKLIFLFLLTMVVSATALNETGNIRGQVTDTKGRTLTGVQVTALHSDSTQAFTSISDRFGYYSIDLPEGVYSLHFTYFVNQDTVVEKLAVRANSSLSVDMAISYDTGPKKVSKDIGTFRGDGGIEKTAIGSADMMAAPMSVGRASADGRSEIRVDGIEVAKSFTGGEGAAEAEYSSEDALRPMGSKGPSQAQAGMLTSGEVNDFRKWDFWQDIEETDLNGFQKQWEINPERRYTVQLTTQRGNPVIDRPVQLLSEMGEIIWAGRTDNTGKAELWANIFADATHETDNLMINVPGENPVVIDDLREFHDGINIIELPEECYVPANVDIVFAVDATGSMGDEIDYLKAEVLDILGKIEDKYDNLNINLGSIFYRDTWDSYIVRKSKLSPDFDKTDAFIKEQVANGGGDFPEAVDRALQSAVNEMNWSENAVSRILFLILDAPPHEDPHVKNRLKEISARAAMMGIRIIPVTCSGIDKSTEYLMRSMALATNGTYVFLTDDSGIGNPHIEPTTDKYDVEFLNDLFIRLIDQFTATPDCSDEPLAGLEVNDNIYNHDETGVGEDDDGYEDIYSMLSCFPNPTAGELTIEVRDGVDEFFLVDIAGKIIQRFNEPGEGSMRMDLGRYPTGVYFLKFRVGSKWAGIKVMLMR